MVVSEIFNCTEVSVISIPLVSDHFPGLVIIHTKILVPEGSQEFRQKKLGNFV